MTSFEAFVCSVADLTAEVREIELELMAPPGISFAAGQFISFEVQAPEWPYPITRSYSIASNPDERRRITLLLNLVTGGRMSPYLFGLRVGDPVTFRGPLGTFCLRPGGRDLLFVATGTGIAPMRSMLHSLASEKSARRITLFWGLRSRADLYYQAELAQLAERLPRVLARDHAVAARRGVGGFARNGDAARREPDCDRVESRCVCLRQRSHDQGCHRGLEPEGTLSCLSRAVLSRRRVGCVTRRSPVCARSDNVG